MTTATLTPELLALAGADLERRKRERGEEAHRYDWRNVGACSDEDCRYHARPKQLPPDGDWHVWLILTGRGWGKTRTGSEWIREQVEAGKRRIALVAETAADGRDVMAEGESGILETSPPWCRPHYEPSKRRLTWPNGAIATIYSADDPEQLRGPQHDAAWCDEAAKWRRAETFDNLMLGLRLGDDPRCLVTTTPRATKFIRGLRGAASTVTTIGHTYENLDNLAPTFREQVMKRYEGTRLGRQELAGEVLEDIEGAMWEFDWIEANRVEAAPEMSRIVVAVDPAVTYGEDSDETGITVVGRGATPCRRCSVAGFQSDYYVLSAEGYRVSPKGWAKRVLDAYDQYQADRIIAERNNGGDMVEATIRQVSDTAPVTTIVASRGKTVRAEPVVALYEQGRVHHVGVLAALEEQQCSFPVANELDDILDAVVYGVTELEGPSWILT